MHTEQNMNNRLILKLQIKQQSMQELFQLIKQRFEKLHIVTKSKLSNDQYREIREQQKTRCEKEAWILSMFRSKKANMTASVKNNYFKYSYQIMKIIDPDFQYEGQPNLSDENFLNDFVCLYTKFFDNYEDKFQFKIKVRNLLRPTNHNIINDMVKYLADFSRDYSQHVYLWQMKESKKQEQIAQESKKRLSISNNSQSVIYQSNNQNSFQSENSKQKPMQSFRNSVNMGNIGESSFKKYNQQSETQVMVKKNELNRMYGILDIQPLPNFIFIEKIKSNIDVLRLRMNQLYRDSKFRNNMIKNSISLYYNGYHLKNNPSVFPVHTNKQNLIEDTNPHISHPYRVSLVIERNGFSCINITTHENERNLSPMKDKIRLSSLSNKDSTVSQIASKTTKNQFILNSLKVLRVSQNFLPPLVSRKQSRVNSQQQTGKQQTLLKKLSYSNTENLVNLQVQGAKQLSEASSHNGVIYYNQQLLREAERRKVQKRRISELRKHFTSQQKGKSKGVKKSDPEQKIVEWLDKINLMKQLQRKKILGFG